MDKYLKEHPNADKRNHSVKKQEKKVQKKEQKVQKLDKTKFKEKVYQKLINHKDTQIRKKVAEHQKTPAHILDKLKDDEDYYIFFSKYSAHIGKLNDSSYDGVVQILNYLKKEGRGKVGD